VWQNREGPDDYDDDALDEDLSETPIIAAFPALKRRPADYPEGWPFVADAPSMLNEAFDHENRICWAMSWLSLQQPELAAEHIIASLFAEGWFPPGAEVTRAAQDRLAEDTVLAVMTRRDRKRVLAEVALRAEGRCTLQLIDAHEDW
jgi:hypothetical protein